MGLEHELGVLEAGRLADIILLDSDPLADIRVLQGGEHLAMVIKDGRVVDLNGVEDSEPALAFAAPVRA